MTMKWGQLAIQAGITVCLYAQLGDDPNAVNLLLFGWSIFALVLNQLVPSQKA